MCAVGRTVEPRTLDPGMDDASVLPSREMRLCSETAREQVAPVPEFDLRQPIMDRGPGLLHNFELDRSPCLFLDHGTAVSHPAASAYVVDLQADEIATSELAVDREVEQVKISFPDLQLEPNPNGPDIFRLERALLAGQTALVPGTRLQETGSGIAVCMVASSIPTVPLPAPPMRRHANLPKDRFRRACGRSTLGAPMSRQRRNRPFA